MASMYFIALVLPEFLQQKILPLKQKMYDQYGCRTGLKSPAHITLLPPYWMDESLEKELIADLDMLSSQFEPFTLHTAGFSCFRPRTIFIATAASEELNRIKAVSDVFFGTRFVYKMKTDRRPFHPHITIATRDLAPKDFYDAWPFFEKGVFSESFEVNSMSLLRHNQKNWDVVHTSRFNEI